jgi:hypothetical protein
MLARIIYIKRGNLLLLRIIHSLLLRIVAFAGLSLPHMVDCVPCFRTVAGALRTGNMVCGMWLATGLQRRQLVGVRGLHSIMF